MREQKKIDVGPLFNVIARSKKRINLLQGGTRSSKTVSLMIFWLTKMLQEPGSKLSIVRKTTPALRSSVWQDFVEFSSKMGIYELCKINLSSLTVTLPNKSIIEFFAVDNPQKVRGRKRKYLWMNELNELTQEDVKQLLFRTEGDLITGDYNPSFIEHEVIDGLIARDDCELHISTYKDNPFLPDVLVKEIELLEHTDPNLWRIYGMGQRAIPEGLVFPKYTKVKLDEDWETQAYGLDWGDNDPTALTGMRLSGDNLQYKEYIYRTHLDLDELVNLMKSIGIDSFTPIYCDHRPELIRYLKKAGFNAQKAVKGPNSIEQGILLMKTHNIQLDEYSLNLIKEFSMYGYIQKDGKYTDTPVDAFNHSIDSARYALMSFMARFRGKNKGKGLDIDRSPVSNYTTTVRSASSYT